MKEFEVALGETKSFSNGLTFIAEVVDPLITAAPNEVEIHESLHAAVAPEDLIEMSVGDDGTGSLGRARFRRYRRDAMAAPMAMGHVEGKGSDEAKLIYFGDLEAGKSEARAVLAKRQEFVEVLAGVLARKKKLSGSEVRGIKKRVETGERVKVWMIDRDGNEKMIERHGVKGSVRINMKPNVEYELGSS